MSNHLRQASFQAMGSYCEIQIFEASRITAKQLVRRLISEAQRLENKYSRYRPDSFLSLINNSAGSDNGIEIDDETMKLFAHAKTCFEQSEGLFDVTAGILRTVWDFRVAKIPEPEKIAAALQLIGYDKLSWQCQTLYLPANMEVDFGGIVKEYAADALANLALQLGVKHGLINMGGDYAVIGPRPEEAPWLVGVANPTQPDQIMAHINLRDGGLASSGDYERCFELDGKRYSHILNPKTGWPSSGLRAVSVAANLCTVAGSFATIAMLKPENEALSWLEESGLPFVYMDSSEQIKGPALGSS